MQNPFFSQDTEACADSYLIPPCLLPSFHSPWSAPKSWTWGISWARFPPPSPALVASQAGQGLLSHSFPRGWGSTLPMPALWGHTLPSTSVTAWEERAAPLQERLHLKCPIHTTQADYNYKLKEKIKVPRLWFVFLSANCQLHEKLYFVGFFPSCGFYRMFYFKPETNMEKSSYWSLFIVCFPTCHPPLYLKVTSTKTSQIHS